MPNRIAGEFRGNQRGRASRIDRGARSVEIEFVRDAVRDDAHRPAGAGMNVLSRAAITLNLRIVGRAGAHKHAGVRATEPLGGNAGVFERFPNRHQHHALLRVHRFCFARRNAEKFGVEISDAFDKTAPANRRLSHRMGIGIVERVEAEAVVRDFLDAATAVAQKRPEFLGIAHFAGQRAADTHDGERFEVGIVFGHVGCSPPQNSVGKGSFRTCTLTNSRGHTRSLGHAGTARDHRLRSKRSVQDSCQREPAARLTESTAPRITRRYTPLIANARVQLRNESARARFPFKVKSEL